MYVDVDRRNEWTFNYFIWLYSSRWGGVGVCGGGGWWLLRQFLYSVIFTIFQNDQNIGSLYNVTFISDRCHSSRAAETPDKYEGDLKYLFYTFAKYIIQANEKLANGALSPPNPSVSLLWRLMGFMTSPNHHKVDSLWKSLFMLTIKIWLYVYISALLVLWE